MGTCGSRVSCEKQFEKITIEVNPDIVGIGILVAFLLTAAAASISIVYGYFMDMLPEPPDRYLSWVDHGFLRRFTWCGYCRTTSKTHETKEGAKYKPCSHTIPKNETKRREGLLRFMLSLSDQQLVTGLAMIIASLSQRCEISCYEFKVVSSLAWLASVTHIGCLIALVDHFRNNKAVRNIRVIAILVNFILLLFVTLETSAVEGVDISAPFQCVLSQPRIFGKQMVSSLLSVLPTVIILFSQYIAALSALYLPEGWIIDDWLLYIYLKWRCCRRGTGPQLSLEEFDEWHSKNIIDSDQRPGSVQEVEKLRRRTAEGLPPSRKFAFTLLIASRGYGWAFLSQLPQLAYNASYGITQLVFSRTGTPSINGPMNLVDFGQLVPLLLLAIPILTVIEIYYEVPRKASKRLFHNNGSSLKTNVEGRQSVDSHDGTNPENLNSFDEVTSQVKFRTQLPGQSSKAVPTRINQSLYRLSLQATTPDSTIWDPAFSTQIQKYIRIFFIFDLINQTILGVMLWISSTYSLIWLIFWTLLSLYSFVETFLFSAKAVRKSRKIQRSGPQQAIMQLENTQFYRSSSSTSLVGETTRQLNEDNVLIERLEMSGARASSPESISADGDHRPEASPSLQDGLRRRTFDNSTPDSYPLRNLTFQEEHIGFPNA